MIDSIRRQLFRYIWLGPIMLIGITSFLLFFFGHWLDTKLYAPQGTSLWMALSNWQQEVVENFFSNHIAQVIGALLALAITVVSIVVQMAANQLTPRVTDLFIREPVNFLVLSFFVVGCIQSEWVALTFQQGYWPHVGASISVMMMTVGFLLLMPYIAYVFAFLEPKSIITRIEKATQKQVRPIYRSQEELSSRKQKTLDGIENLADMSMTAIQQKNRDIAISGIASLRALVINYLPEKPQMPHAWFEIGDELLQNPDFTSLSDESLSAMVKRKIWFENKIFRQYQALYSEALNKIRDINYVVAIQTRLIAEAAEKTNDAALLDLSIRVMNTYLRATLNAKDVRTAYNVLNQYRLLAESLIKTGHRQEAVQIATHFKYYGQLAYQMGLAFVIETSAYDLCTLLEEAFTIPNAPQDDLLRIFLEIDKESENQEQERSLRGVRKAQIKLATFYLLHNDQHRARLIYQDMADEPAERLSSIRQELENINSPEFWEVIDRGTNFDYLAPERKAFLPEFFSWFSSASSNVV